MVLPSSDKGGYPKRLPGFAKKKKEDSTREPSSSLFFFFFFLVDLKPRALNEREEQTLF